jgi:predicted nuclease of predicted toxin-antitoxin system
MKQPIVADESVDYRIVTELRNNEFQVYSVSEQQPSIQDEVVLKIACDHNALLLTEDKDFGELVFRFKLPHRGILLIRIENPKEKIPTVVRMIKRYYSELIDKFSVLTDSKLRIKD